jgi:hypothetical protein
MSPYGRLAPVSVTAATSIAAVRSAARFESAKSAVGATLFIFGPCVGSGTLCFVVRLLQTTSLFGGEGYGLRKPFSTELTLRIAPIEYRRAARWATRGFLLHLRLPCLLVGNSPARPRRLQLAA